MIFGTKRQTPDKLNMAHSIGGGAVDFIEELVTDLRTASDLAGEVVADASVQIAELMSEQQRAAEAASRYSGVAVKLQGLVA
jgi:hypothetical protein